MDMSRVWIAEDAPDATRAKIGRLARETNRFLADGEPPLDARRFDSANELEAALMRERRDVRRALKRASTEALEAELRRRKEER